MEEGKQQVHASSTFNMQQVSMAALGKARVYYSTSKEHTEISLWGEEYIYIVSYIAKLRFHLLLLESDMRNSRGYTAESSKKAKRTSPSL